ncbi:hypothetical protein CAEBREN_28421 [Caenorhabditis brenneri]|uniref:ATP-dependent DNA helicase n=1 Tax=Caenorhabditis brenneri TaxID=135651 RepID=G0P3B8_CAEBE|nr:hypothetical protein CAEBREN_28421 [Caenorhabditis brenneri]
MFQTAYKNSRLYREQQIAFDRIMEDVEKPVKKPLILFVCGPAGTGKSELIKHLYATVGEEHVLLVSPTAMGARNINGKTIHRAMNFNPRHDNDGVMPPLPSLKLLIIDEISMCDAKLFERIERRLRQLMDNDQVLFGGCTVVMFGDLLQIPPVSGKWIFECKIFFFSFALLIVFLAPIWKHHVQYTELETIVRQESDPEFGQMLKRWRLGYCSHDDKVFLDGLAEKVGQQGWNDYVSYFLSHYEMEKHLMLLSYTNATNAVLNQKVTLSLFKDEELFNISREVRVGQTVRRDLMFRVGINSRVMIFKNHPSGVNGEIGLVEGVECDSENHVKKLAMRQCGTNEAKTLEKCTLACSDDTIAIGLPIQPSYAVTFHKAQGQTLDKVFLVAREKNLPPALFYVGASRVRNRTDLHVLSPNSHTLIQADPSAIAEYIRLRCSIGLSDLPIV